jgi:hypothetical protein
MPMLTWNIGNTTVRNPQRLRGALRLFVDTMSGRPFKKAEQQEFLNRLAAAQLVDSDRVVQGDDGGRKFASAFKQPGFVTDWSRGQRWHITPVGTSLLAHDGLKEVIFLRQLMKYQIPSPLESGSHVHGFRVRPFRLLLRFLKRATEEHLIGLTKAEIALYVLTVLNEDDTGAFEKAISDIKAFRAEYSGCVGKVAKNNLVREKFIKTAQTVGLQPGSLLDYADSSGRYALMTGLLTTYGNKLAISDTRVSLVEAILTDGTTLMPANQYLDYFYNPDKPLLPTDDEAFLRSEIAVLEKHLIDLATLVGEPATLPSPSLGLTRSDLQGYESRLRQRLREVREIQFYRSQCLPEALNEIEDLLEDIAEGSGAFFGGLAYAPAFLEWAIWRLFLAINAIVGPVSKTRGFSVDEDMNPVHHAKGGSADLTFTYKDFTLVCEMTLMSGSRQFAAEGEPVTRHVFKVIENSQDKKPVYGLFVAKKLDPNTVDVFYQARYWQNWVTPVPTPIIALEIHHIVSLIQHMRANTITIMELKGLFEDMLNLQRASQDGPSWYKASIKFYENWLKAHAANQS